MPQAGPAFSNYPAVLGCPDLLLKKRKKNKTVAGITQDQQTTNATCCTCSLWGVMPNTQKYLTYFPSCCPGVSDQKREAEKKKKKRKKRKKKYEEEIIKHEKNKKKKIKYK